MDDRVAFSGPRAPGGGRHRGGRRTPRWVAPLAAAVALGLAAAVVVAVGHDNGDSAVAAARPAGCPDPTDDLQVVAAPDIAPILSTLAQRSGGGRCATLHVTVTPQDPAATSAALVQPSGARPDVWIPDSSLWAGRLPAGTLPATGGYTSVARTPVVLAVAAQTPATMSFATMAASDLTAQPVRWSLGATASSPTQAGVLVGLQTSVAASPTRLTTLAAVVRTMAVAPAVDDTLTTLAQHPTDQVALASSEQAVWLHNAGLHPAQQQPATVRAVYPPAPGSTLDYPYVVLGHDAAAAAWLRTLQTQTARSALQAAGFRAADGASGPQLGPADGVDPAAPATTGAPTPAQDQTGEQLIAALSAPSRLLAVFDVSGSMATVVPGANGATRLDLARSAAANSLALFSPNSMVGLWEFSTDLTPTTDYRQLAPLSVLDPASQAGFSAALAALQVKPDGGTGLYDTVLAAVQAVRSTYDPTRVNTVVVLSDGKNEDNRGISLQALLADLTTADDPQRPVPVITIALGPQSDDAAMQAISTATHGSAYTAKDPNDLASVFLDAIGQRLCRPNCSTAR